VCWGAICKDKFFGILIHAQEHGDMIKYHFFGHVCAGDILAGISPSWTNNIPWVVVANSMLR